MDLPVVRVQRRTCLAAYRRGLARVNLSGQDAKAIAPCPQIRPYPAYVTLAKMITSVYSASDSISTRPSSSANRIAAEAPGLRAIASADAATALACASPH